MSEENKGQKIEIIDQTYRLAEMAEAMRQSIANAQSVAAQQVKLINIISASKDVDEFKDFIKSSEEQIDNLNNQVLVLNTRACILEQIVETCQKDEEKSKLISMLCKALGIFNEQDNSKKN